jgi:hypothetical protein
MSSVSNVGLRNAHERPPDRFPEPIDVSKTGGTQMPGGTIVEAAKESDEYALPFMGTISEDPMIIATNPSYFLGFVKYTDIFNNDITTGFCFLYHAPGEYFLVGGDQYNYRKQERKKEWSGGLSEPAAARLTDHHAPTC